MAQKRKRPPPPQSTTLRQFFFPNTNPAKKSRNRSSTARSEAEAIVISDSDGDLPVFASKGKEKTKQDSSVVGLLRNPDTKRSNDSKGAASHSSPSLPMKKQRAITVVNTNEKEPSFTPEDEDIYSFGESSTLLRTRSPVQLIAPTSSFGPPNELLGPGKALSVTRLSHELFKNKPSKSHEVVTMANFNDEWAMGDDEIALVDVETDDNIEDATVKFDLLHPEVPSFFREEEETVTTCPVCTLLLLGLSPAGVEEHVNTCIDNLSASPSSSVPVASSSVVSLPLSVIQAPYVQSPLTNFTRAPFTHESNNAFSVLMSSHKDNEAWIEAAVAEGRSFKPKKGNGDRRKAPFYKVLQGMPIAVDAFRYGSIPGITAYFLTHAHSDHYTNLASNWKSGPIYCSQGTANLVIHILAVDPKWVHPLPMDIPSVIPNTNGVRVTLIEANHCPGSCLFLFEGPQTINAGDSVFKSPSIGSSRTFRYLHCGDFRASPRHVLHPAVKGKQIDHVYLDNTYLDPKYNFPPQPLVISACAELAKRLANRRDSTTSVGTNDIEANTLKKFMAPLDKPSEKMKQGKILIVVGTYSIGKERIVKAIARALDTKVYCDDRKAAILRCQADPELDSLLVTDPLLAGVHVVPLSIITSDKLKTYMDRFKGEYARVIGFRPTGWTYTAQTGFEHSPSISSILSQSVSRPKFTYSSLTPSRNSTPTLILYGIPYSEHSSFFELTCFAMSLEWGKMIATVNVGSANSRGNIARWIDKWQAERKRREKWQIIKYRDLDYW